MRGLTIWLLYTIPKILRLPPSNLWILPDLSKEPAKGEGLGNKFLSHIREVDAIVQVVRCFGDENITHVDGSVKTLCGMWKPSILS